MSKINSILVSTWCRGWLTLTTAGGSSAARRLLLSINISTSQNRLLYSTCWRGRRSRQRWHWQLPAYLLSGTFSPQRPLWHHDAKTSSVLWWTTPSGHVYKNSKQQIKYIKNKQKEKIKFLSSKGVLTRVDKNGYKGTTLAKFRLLHGGRIEEYE